MYNHSCKYLLYQYFNFTYIYHFVLNFNIIVIQMFLFILDRFFLSCSILISNELSQ